MTALQVYASTNKEEMAAYFNELKKQGVEGQFATFLLLAQRSQHQLRLLLDREIPNKEYERLRRSRNNFAITRMLTFAGEHLPQLKIKAKNFKYGVRLKFQGGAAIRFRTLRGEWLGDADNLNPICEYCDRLVERGRSNERPGEVLSWPAAI